jgi:glucosamine-6-phosphate deaminase
VTFLDQPIDAPLKNRYDVGRRDIMRIIQTTDFQEMSRTAALLILNLLLNNPQAVIGLATGHTPKGLYREWVLARYSLGIAMNGLHFCHLDEYLGLGSDHPESMAAILRQQLIQPLGITPDRIHYMPGTAEDPEQACREYEALIAQLGGLDLQILGIGQNGHIAFNEPGTPFDQHAHVTTLSPSTRKANASAFSNKETPAQAMTLGPATIMGSRRILLMASGSSKATAIQNMLEGPLDENCPATLLRFHPNATLVLDREAAAKLSPATLQPAEYNHPIPLSVFAKTTPLLDSPQRILVCAPHPDDASISCGGTLARLKQEGHELLFISMTTGHRADIPGTDREQRIVLRQQESEAEAALFDSQALGLELDFYERGYCPSSADVTRIRSVLSTFKPTLVFSASEEDRHPAHRMSALLLKEALMQHVQNTGQSLQLWSYEGPWFLFARDDFNTVVELEESHLALKLAGIQAHRSQIVRKRYDQAAESLARFRAITTPESRLSSFGSELQNVGEAIEVFQRVELRPRI